MTTIFDLVAMSLKYRFSGYLSTLPPQPVERGWTRLIADIGKEQS